MWERAQVLRLALGFYFALACLGLLWWGLRGDPSPGDPGAALSWAGLGLIFGLCVVILSRWLNARFAWARDLSESLAERLELPLSWRNCALLAASSALGEELFFRAGMQPSLGLWPTAIIFALAHAPVERRLLPWTGFSLLFGLAVGWGYEVSGQLSGPVAAHFVINLLNLRALGELRAAPQ